MTDRELLAYLARCVSRLCGHTVGGLISDKKHLPEGSQEGKVADKLIEGLNKDAHDLVVAAGELSEQIALGRK